METTDYVSYDLALKLKACGFDEPCDCYYTNGYANDNPEDISRVVKMNNGSVYNHNKVLGADGEHISAVPLWHAQKWLREKWGIFVEVTSEALYDWDFFVMELDEDANVGVVRGSEIYPSYEAALSAGISAALELIKKGE